MKVKIMLACALLLSVVFASSFDTFEDTDDYGCKYIDDRLWCVEPAIVLMVEATATEDVWCYSTEAFEDEDFSCDGAGCADYIDIGCLTMIQLETDIVADIPWIAAEETEDGIVTNPEIETEYGTVMVPADEYASGISTDVIDFSGCVYVDDEAAVKCPFEGTKMAFDGGVVGDSAGIDFMIMDIPYYGEVSVDITAFFSENILYIALLIVIIIVAIQLFRPKKAGKRTGKPI